MSTETELACIEHDAQAGLADLGLRLVEAKQFTAALQAGRRFTLPHARICEGEAEWPSYSTTT